MLNWSIPAFQSDCAFDNFISPITNPFLAEDPRSLTELRPLYFYQAVPDNQYYLQGGHLSFLGAQARAAFTDRFSIVLHKVGWSSVTAGNTLATSDTGFSETIQVSDSTPSSSGGPRFIRLRVAEAAVSP